MKKSIVEALFDVEFTKGALLFFAQNSPSYLQPEEVVHDKNIYPNKKTFLYFEPIGTIAAIKPWNFPFDLPIWSCIAPALMAGNAVILKPSPLTTKTGELIEDIFLQAGASEGLIQTIIGDDEVGKELVQVEGIDMISFTGSIKTGHSIASECAKMGKKYVLEMGGKDVAIVFPDCDIKTTLNGITMHGFMNNGQVCTSIERLLIHKNIYKEFLDKLILKVKEITPVPFANKNQFLIVRKQLEEAVQTGCHILIGGKNFDEDKNIIEPTILECIDTSLDIWQKESFGPVLAVRSFESVEQVIRLANNSIYGLGASVWTNNIDIFSSLAKKLEVGMVWQNEANLPFLEGVWTGWKQSGFGVSLGKHGTRVYTKIKQISESIF